LTKAIKSFVASATTDSAAVGVWYGRVWYGIVEFNVPLDTV